MHTNLPTCAQTKVMSSTTNLQTLVAFSLCRQQAVHACSAVHQRRAQSVHFWADPANPATTRQWQSFYSRFGGSSPASSQIRKKCATPFLKLWIIFTNTICHNAHHHWEPLNDKEISVGFFLLQIQLHFSTLLQSSYHQRSLCRVSPGSWAAAVFAYFPLIRKELLPSYT